MACLMLGTFVKNKNLVFILPIVCVLCSYASCDYVMLCAWIGILYVSRIFLNDKLLQQIPIQLFSLLFIVISIVHLPQVTILAVIIFIFTIPIPNKEKYQLSLNRIVAYASVTFIAISLFAFCAWKLNHNERKSAYLCHGVWCKPSPIYEISSLNNSSAYSYSELCQMLNADSISNLSNISKYNELWIMTPTKQFTPAEKNNIYRWVKNGGHLIVGTDHTDLYGHARVVNDLLYDMGCKVSYSSVFETDNATYFYNCVGKLCPLKTPNSIEKMNFGFPLLSIIAWNERAYYDNDNFFGPMAANANNIFNINSILSTRPYGLGRVTILADTTFCANFAIFQPYVREFINFIISYHAEVLILFILSIVFLVFVCVKDRKRILLATAFYSFLPIILTSLYPRKIPIEGDAQIWTGNRNFVAENNCPFSCISTAYSLAALSGKNPYWQDVVNDSVEDVIWVDSVPPRNSKWRWIHVTDNHNHFYDNGKYDKKFEHLYRNLNALEVWPYQDVYHNYKELKVECVFNDAVMNDWWYGNFGLSEVRKNRIEAWIHWLSEDSLPKNFKYSSSDFSEELYPAWLHIKDKQPIEMDLPKPVINGVEEINFGCGIVGKMVSRENDTIKIIGLHEFSENWDCPQIWTLTYIP